MAVEPIVAVFASAGSSNGLPVSRNEEGIAPQGNEMRN
jgi:hypothetical protein